MIPAFHYVRGGSAAVDSILKEGEIIPAVYRLDVQDLRNDCERLLTRMDFASQGTERKVSGEAVHGIHQLIEQRFAELRDVQGQRKLPLHGTTGFRCVDLLAGDLFNIFLSVGDWERGLGGWGFTPNGFVFDSDELIDAGATFRTADFYEVYDEIIMEMMWGNKFSTPEEAIQFFLDNVEDLKHRRESSGQRAFKMVKLFQDGSELLFPGPIPIELAKEIWKNGKKINKTKAMMGVPVPRENIRKLIFFRDLDHPGGPGGIIGVYLHQWHHSARGVVDGWRGPEHEPEEFFRSRLGLVYCPIPWVAPDGTWRCTLEEWNG